MQIDVRTHMDLNEKSDYARNTIQPGLTEDGNPTTDINETIPYFEIEKDDNWDIISTFKDFGEDKS